MDNKNYICDVYVYHIYNGDLIEGTGKLYRGKSANDTGSLYIGGAAQLTLTGVQLQPGVVWCNSYIWFYKPNKRAAAKAFQNVILEQTKEYSAIINKKWALYDILSSYTK